MATFRQSRSLLALAAVAAILSWMVAANHCAAVALTSAPQEHACCHQNSAKLPSGCCKSLNVPLPDTAKAPAAFLVLALPWESSGFEELDVPGNFSAEAGAAFLEGSPPEALSFAERILSGILAAHAPPVVVI